MILLDTHIFLWMNLQQERLTSGILNAVQEEKELGLAAISLWEMSMLVQYRRVSIPDPSLMDWFGIVLDAPKLLILPLTPRIAARSGTVSMHGDPADRLIVATALEHNCRLATVDERLLNMESLSTVH